LELVWHRHRIGIIYFKFRERIMTKNPKNESDGVERTKNITHMEKQSPSLAKSEYADDGKTFYTDISEYSKLDEDLGSKKGRMNKEYR
jgi:hypothetical protein